MNVSIWKSRMRPKADIALPRDNRRGSPQGGSRVNAYISGFRDMAGRAVVEGIAVSGRLFLPWRYLITGWLDLGIFFKNSY